MQIKRRFRRWQIDKQASVKLKGAERFIPCIINDISFMGAKITLPLKLPEDTFIQLTLSLAENIFVELETWVVWHKCHEGRNSYALYFSKIDEQSKEKIYRYIYLIMPKEIERHMEKDFTETPGHIGMAGVRYCEGGEHMEDRRVFQRFSIRFPMRFLDLKNNQEGFAETQDISAKGIGLRTSMALENNAPVEVWLQIPDKGEPLYTRGQVVWTGCEGKDDWRAGVSLEKADLMGLSRILRTQ